MRRYSLLALGLGLFLGGLCLAADSARTAHEIRPVLIGAAAPQNVEVLDADGRAVKLSAIFQSQPTVLAFYRGDW